MKPSDVDRLLALIDAERGRVMRLDNATVHFLGGALYGLDKAEQIVKRVNVETPTCLIHCRQQPEEDQ